MKKQLATAGLLCTLLAACGGGSSDNPPAPAPTPAPVPAATAEGFWAGQASTGTSVTLAVLENGDTWGYYMKGGYIVGALAGSTTSSGNQLSGSGKDFNLPARTVASGSYAGTFRAKDSISVQLSDGSTFTGRYDARYDQPALLAALAGTFSGQGVTGYSAVQAASITITPSGAVSMPAVGGCSASGTVAPRASGKNIFDVTVVFSGSACALGNGAMVKGVGFYNSTDHTLIGLALNGAKNDGFIYFGQKAS